MLKVLFTISQKVTVKTDQILIAYARISFFTTQRVKISSDFCFNEILK